jgi:hypothetical protein
VVVEGIAAAHQNKERTKQVMAKYMQTDDAALLERTYNATAPG